MDIDAGFINWLYLVDTKRFRQVIKDIPIKYVQGEERFIYTFMLEYYKENKAIPSRIATKKKFPNFKVIKPKDKLNYYIKELKSRVVYEKLTRGISEVQNLLLDKDVEKAKKEILSLGISLGEEDRVESLGILDTLDMRLNDYEEAKKNEGIIGMYTGIDPFDERLGGLLDEIVVIMGKSGVGKTFLSLFIMNELWRQVKGTVAYVTNEISQMKIAKRVDSVVAKVPYSLYRKGMLDSFQEKKIRTKLPKIYSRRKPLEIINGAGKSVDEIEYELLSMDNIGLLVVDGIYLTDMGSTDPFKNTLMASRAYKRLVSRLGIPSIFTTQMNEDEETKYAKAIKEDCDVLIKMFQTPALKVDEIMGLEFIKVREEESGFKAWLNWKFKQWDFTEYNMLEGEEEYEQEYE